LQLIRSKRHNANESGRRFFEEISPKSEEDYEDEDSEEDMKYTRSLTSPDGDQDTMVKNKVD
jgi:hypothetical protein